MREVAPIQGDAYIAPLIPAMRTSADGRVAMNMKRIRNKVAFFAFAPERLDVPLADAPAGAGKLSSTTPYGGGLNAALFHASESSGSLTHMTLCDGTQDESAPGEPTNPYACGDGHDCYDLTMIGVWDPQPSGVRGVIELWGTPVTVEIAGPKAADARIVDIQVGEPVLGPTWAIHSFFEAMGCVLRGQRPIRLSREAGRA